MTDLDYNQSKKCLSCKSLVYKRKDISIKRWVLQRFCSTKCSNDWLSIEKQKEKTKIIDGILIEKKCTKCKKSKNIQEFSKCMKNTDGFNCWCKDCFSIASRTRRNNNYDKFIVRERYLRYGLSQEDYDTIYMKQLGLCALCHYPFGNESPCIDHKHVGGYAKLAPENKKQHIRGLLHRKCNFLIGIADEKIETLNEAIEYLGKEYHACEID